MRLEELKKQEAELLRELDANRAEQRKINTSQWCKDYGVNIGDAVEFVDGKNTISGQLSRFEYSGTTVKSAMVSEFNKSGEVGKREKRLWFYSLSSLRKITK